jgi:hypothetical protein
MDNFHPQSVDLHLKEGHEESDLSPRAIILFGVALVISGAIAFVAVLGLYYGLEYWRKTHEAQLTPVEQVQQSQEAAPAATEQPPLPAAEAARQQTEEHLARTFPAPRLQGDDASDMSLFLNSEDQWLDSTGRDANGNIHIPIDRAIDLLLQRGLPQVSGPYLQPNNLPTAVPLVPAGPSRSLIKK